MKLKTIAVPSWLALPFRLIREFVSGGLFAVNGPHESSVTVAPDWSVRVSRDRQSIEVDARVSLRMPLSPDLSRFLSGQSSLPVAEGVSLCLDHPLMLIANQHSVSRDGAFRLPEGLTAEVDGLPDPLVTSVRFSQAAKGEVATAYLQAAILQHSIELVAGKL